MPSSAPSSPRRSVSAAAPAATPAAPRNNPLRFGIGKGRRGALFHVVRVHHSNTLSYRRRPVSMTELDPGLRRDDNRVDPSMSRTASHAKPSAFDWADPLFFEDELGEEE